MTLYTPPLVEGDLFTVSRRQFDADIGRLWPEMPLHLRERCFRALPGVLRRVAAAALQRQLAEVSR
jgi:hypothetical protein